MSDHDIIIIGGGPGGYTAALAAEKAGLKTCLIEKEKLGGTCLHRGCIPTKALLEGSHRSADFSGLYLQKDKVVLEIYKSLEGLFARGKVKVLKGEASFLSPSEISVQTSAGTEKLSASHFVIASGSRPTEISPLQVDGKRIHSSDTILELKELPKDLVIVGGGFIGVEFASIFSKLGTKVTIVEALDRLLPIEDKEIGLKLALSFKKQGIDILLNEKIKSASSSVSNLECHFESGKALPTSEILVAIGRTSNIEDLGLDKAGVETRQKKIVTNDHLETSVKNIYAIGDVIEGPQLAHRASYDAHLVIQNIQGKDQKRDYSLCPSAVYSHPEAASIGLTRERAEAQGLTVEEGKSLFQASGRARVMDQAEGFVKLIAERSTGRLLGAQILGPYATELISELTVAIRSRMTLKDLASTIHPHPTLSESIQEAAQAGLEKIS